MSCEILVLVDSIKKKYGNIAALNGVSFDIKHGEIIGLLGPNGAGKSTFFSILSTISSPTYGDIFINGVSIKKDKNYARKLIGYIPQEIALYPTLTGLDNLIFWANMYGIKDTKKAIDDIVTKMNIDEIIHRKVETYSGGMKRILNIAVGILHNPPLLIMDEPLVGVDVITKKKILDTILKLKSNGTSIIFSSHSIDEIEKTCDRIVLLDKGAIRDIGTLEQLLFKYSANSLEDILLNS